MLSSVLTSFDRDAVPANLLTVEDWRNFGRRAYNVRSWESAALKYAEAQGGALILLHDDRLVAMTKTSGGKIRRKTFRPGTWRWQPRAAR